MIVNAVTSACAIGAGFESDGGEMRMPHFTKSKIPINNHWEEKP